jgi:hypothetical protein
MKMDKKNLERLVERDKYGNFAWTAYAEELCKDRPEAVGELARRLIWEHEQSREGIQA